MILRSDGITVFIDKNNQQIELIYSKIIITSLIGGYYLENKVVCLVPKERFITTGVRIPEQLSFIFSDTRDEDEIIELCKNASFLFCSSGTSYISESTVEKLNSIRMIQVDGVGYEKIDVRACANNSIPVANNANVNALTVAEAALGMIITLQRRYLVADSYIKARKYQVIHERFVKEGLNELSGRRVGLIGLGAIGIELAKLLIRLEADVYYNDIFWRTPEFEAEIGLKRMTREEIFTECDIISLHVPLTESTRHLIDEKALSMMKKTAILINTARGEVIDQVALVNALESGHLYGVAIDTIHPEPPMDDHPLLNLSEEAKERIMFTPHIAGVTLEAFRRMLLNGIENIIRAIKGEEILNVVNGISKPRDYKV